MRKSSFKKKAINYMLDYGIVGVLIVLIIIFTISSDRFFKSNTLFTILRQVSVSGIVSVGMTFVMLTGGIDLSTGAIAGVSCIVAALLMKSGIPIWISIVICILIACVLGMINAFCVTALRIPPLIGTLGVQTSLRGACYLLSGGTPVYGVDKSIGKIAQGALFGIPYMVILMFLVFLIGWYVLTRTRYGRYVYGVGGNEEASRLSGIAVVRVKYMVYIVSAALSSIAGILLLSRTGSGQPSAGEGYEMNAITAVVLGGVSINGGVGNIWLVIVGVVIMGVLSTGMVMNNISDYVQQVIKGLVLVGAVAFAQFSQKVKSNSVER